MLLSISIRVICPGAQVVHADLSVRPRLFKIILLRLDKSQLTQRNEAENPPLIC